MSDRDRPPRPSGAPVPYPPCVLAVALLPVLLVFGPWTGGGPGLAAQEEEPGVPFVSTPMEVVRTMLELAGTTAADTVYDLGSGDGRIPIMAARRYGATGVGVELDSSLVALSRRKAEEAGVEERVRFIRGDLFDADLRPATVLALYLTTRFNVRLRPKILRQLRPGSRVVTHVFDMGRWQADTVVHRIEHGAFLYLYTVPADVEGTWRVEVGSGAPFAVELDQRFQELRPVSGGERTAPRVEEAEVAGDTVRLTVSGLRGRERPTRLVGTAAGDRMGGATEEGLRWSARRTGDGGGSLERWTDEADGASGDAGGRAGPRPEPEPAARLPSPSVPGDASRRSGPPDRAGTGALGGAPFGSRGGTE